jgi:hypothetical protein
MQVLNNTRFLRVLKDYAPAVYKHPPPPPQSLEDPWVGGGGEMVREQLPPRQMDGRIGGELPPPLPPPWGGVYAI